jgi:PAS domain S-box-containing protein
MNEPEGRWCEEFFDALYQYTWILDVRGKVVKANQSALKLTGLTEQAITDVSLESMPWRELSRQNRRMLKWGVNQAMLGRLAIQDLEIHRRRQPTTTINFSFKPVLLANGELNFITVEGRDVTVDKHTSDALYQSEARFQTIFEEAGIGILIKDDNGKMLGCNPAFQAMLGYTDEEIIQFDYLDITHPQDKRLSRKLFNELVNGKRKNYQIEKRYLHKNGQPIWSRITASLVLETDHQAQFVIAMVEDINTQKEIENELIEMQQRLMRGREMERLRLAQDLHDGPLQDIIGLTYQVQALENTVLEVAERDQLQAIQTALYQLTRSVRATCGELRPPTLVSFGLEKTIRSHAGQFQEAHPELTIDLSLAEDGQNLSELVRITLFRIYQEALNNIVRHAQASQVWVRFWLEEEQANLEIQDNGKGFELPNRWINFARQGHLGIVGAMERAKEIGGNLEVTAKPGKGTVMRAVIPLKEEISRFLYQEVQT